MSFFVTSQGPGDGANLGGLEGADAHCQLGRGCRRDRQDLGSLSQNDEPNRHDILAGSNADGTAHEATCENWTASGEGSAMVGHHDCMGLDDSAEANSWNSSHPSRGCGQEALQGTGGDGLFYCFATD